MKMKNRRMTCRSFSNNLIKDNILHDIASIASLAPVGMNLYNKFQIKIVNSINVYYLRKHLIDHFKGEDVTYNAAGIIIINIDEETYKKYKTTCDKSAGAIAVFIESHLKRYRLGATISEAIYDFYNNYKVNSVSKGNVVLKNGDYVPILAIFIGYPKRKNHKKSHHPIKSIFYTYHKEDDDRFQ